MAISRRALFGKLDLTLFRAIESATAFAKLRGNPFVEIIHWLHQILQSNNSDIHLILRKSNISTELLAEQINHSLSLLPAGATSISDFSQHIETAIERAWVIATLVHGDNKIRSAWLLEALLATPELRRLVLSTMSALEPLANETNLQELPRTIIGSPEYKEVAHDGSGLSESLPGEASNALVFDKNNESALTKFCTDLTDKARHGFIDPVIGRDKEVRTLVDILLRRRQNNPLLIGEAGVGKTAVVEGFALAIVAQNVPPNLQQARILSLDIGLLVAGASMRGEFEARLKNVLSEAEKSPVPIIMFIDEVHTLVGAGGQTGTGDASNLLKPALARGALRTIGATTWSEYKKHIEKDPALTRRFQVLQVDEPDEDAAINMVRGLVKIFSKYHQIAILNEAVEASVRLSQRYIPSRQLPDKAISLLDTACARVAMSLNTPPAEVVFLQEQSLALKVERELLASEIALGKNRDEYLADLLSRENQIETELEVKTAAWQAELEIVQKIIILRQRIEHAKSEYEDDDFSIENAFIEIQQLESRLHTLQSNNPMVHGLVDAEIIAQIVSSWTGIPVGRMNQDSVISVKNLYSLLTERVIGQPHSLSVIAQRVQTSKARLTDPNKPVGTFLLVGPSGVGKTETALAIADALYGGEQNLITINMSEYQEAHTVSSLKGSPPGYVGYGEGGVLTEAVRRRPYSVILLDEVEKAHPDVHELFYQVFDKGWMEDGEGRVIDFKNTLILLTSNTGSDLITQLCDDPELIPDNKKLQSLLQPELRKVFPAAFLGRLVVAPYLPLAQNILIDIVTLQLNRVINRMNEQHGIRLIFNRDVSDFIVNQCGTHESGARLLAQFIETIILPPLANCWLDALQNKQIITHIYVEVATQENANLLHSGGLSYRIQHST